MHSLAALSETETARLDSSETLGPIPVPDFLPGVLRPCTLVQRYTSITTRRTAQRFENFTHRIDWLVGGASLCSVTLLLPDTDRGIHSIAPADYVPSHVTCRPGRLPA